MKRRNRSQLAEHPREGSRGNSTATGGGHFASPPAQSTRASSGRTILLAAGLIVLAAAILLGMATKEVTVTAPVIVLVYDRMFLAGTFREIPSPRAKESAPPAR